MSNYGYNGGYGGGSASPIRILIGLVIAGIGLITYFSSTQVNQYTHRKQHISLSPQQEIQMGLNSAPEMASEMHTREITPPDRQAILVQRVGQRLAAGPEPRSSEYAGHFQYHLLADAQTVNAFALPGGQIFITKGLLDRLTNEDQLAGVLGHETGHVLARHSAELLAKAQLGQSLVTAAAVGSDRYSHAAAAQVANQMLQLKFSRGDESEADAKGVELMAEAGYNPTGMLDVMKVLQKVSAGGATPEFMQTHPNPEHRLDDLVKILKEKYPDKLRTYDHEQQKDF